MQQLPSTLPVQNQNADLLAIGYSVKRVKGKFAWRRATTQPVVRQQGSSESESQAWELARLDAERNAPEALREEQVKRLPLDP